MARKSAPASRTSTVAKRLEELRVEQDVDRKELAGAVGKRRQTVDSALRGRSNMLLPDAEAIAERLGAKLEVVQHRNPVNEFRRALDANADLSDQWRETIWSAFRQAKADAATPASARVRPKGRAASSK